MLRVVDPAAPRCWYVSYGSNLSSERLACYLAGGRPPGGRWTTPGARDPSPPTADRGVELDRALWFGGPSHTWSGGPAYLDVDVPGRTLARAWLLTHEQFEDVVAQENQLVPGSLTVDRRLLEEGGVLLPGSRYGRLLSLPSVGDDDTPAVTFTYVERPRSRVPDPAYLAMLGAGLTELGLTREEADAYLGAQPQLMGRAVRVR